jgi:hypothetical protein
MRLAATKPPKEVKAMNPGSFLKKINPKAAQNRIII